MPLLSAALLMAKAEALKRGSPLNKPKVMKTQNGRVYALDENQKHKPRSATPKMKEGSQQMIPPNSADTPITTTLPIFSAPASIEYNVAKIKPKRLGQKMHLSSFTSSVTIERRNIWAQGQDGTNTTNSKQVSKGRVRVKKNATWRVYPENNSSIKAREEMNPWVIDDARRGKKWAGQLNGENDEGHWALLTRQGNYFEFTPLNRFYEFHSMDQVVGKRREAKTSSAALFSRLSANGHVKLPDGPNMEFRDPQDGLSCITISDGSSEFGEGGDVDELSYEKDPSDDEDGYGHDGLAEDADEKDIRERMKRALILDTDGGRDRTMEPSEEYAAQRQDWIQTFKFVAKHVNPDAETDHYDEDNEDEDDVYKLKYNQVDSGEELSPPRFLLGVQPQNGTIKRLSPIATHDITSMMPPAEQALEKGKKSPKPRRVGVPKKDSTKMLGSQINSNPSLPVSGTSLIPRVAIQRKSPVRPYVGHRCDPIPPTSSLAAGAPTPAKLPSQTLLVSASCAHDKATKRKEVRVDESGKAPRVPSSPNPTSITVDPNPSPTKKKKTNNMSRPPCPTFDDLVTLLRVNGGAMQVHALRRRYQTRKYLDNRDIVTQFVQNSHFVAISKAGPRDYWARLKPQHMQP
ncbi:hypothetical protein FRC01_011239 [Tulasnella sp. 417]|nr:hypothetical protein FRC01_011239 [Tulasnella sp. 417]